MTPNTDNPDNTSPQRRSRSERESFARNKGLSAAQARTLAALDSPAAIQDFVNAIPVNYDDDAGVLSVKQALLARRAQCLEGGFIAAFALWMAGETPWMLLLKAEDGEDHVVVPFLREGHWGAISKTNHVWLRWRDPVYQSVRELVMSYFHEYVTDQLLDGKTPSARKTLRAYSPLFDLSTISTERWVTATTDCREIDAMLHELGHYPLLSAGQIKQLRERDAIECQAGLLREYEPPAGFVETS